MEETRSLGLNLSCHMHVCLCVCCVRACLCVCVWMLRYVYWTNTRTDTINRVTLGGSGFKKIVTRLTNPFSLTIDYERQRLYWISQTSVPKVSFLAWATSHRCLEINTPAHAYGAFSVLFAALRQFEPITENCFFRTCRTIVGSWFTFFATFLLCWEWVFGCWVTMATALLQHCAAVVCNRSCFHSICLQLQSSDMDGGRVATIRTLPSPVSPRGGITLFADKVYITAQQGFGFIYACSKYASTAPCLTVPGTATRNFSIAIDPIDVKIVQSYRQYVRGEFDRQRVCSSVQYRPALSLALFCVLCSNSKTVRIPAWLNGHVLNLAVFFSSC